MISRYNPIPDEMTLCSLDVRVSRYSVFSRTELGLAIGHYFPNVNGLAVVGGPTSKGATCACEKVYLPGIESRRLHIRSLYSNL